MSSYTELVLDMENLYVEINGKTVLENINLKIFQGEIVAIVGPNGGGKTTLIKTILGLVKPTKGQIRVFGFKPIEAVRKHLIGYVPQRINLKKESCLSALDVVLLGMWFMKLPKEEKIKRALQSLAYMEVEHLKDKKFADLSGGQQQRVNIARAIAGEPKLLLLDEPTTGIDFAGQQTFYSLIEKLRDEKGFTVLMVSHDVGVVWKYVDKAVCINRKLHYHGEPSAILRPEILRKVYGTEVLPLFHQHD
jgi:zinc transport system ATP-binding protein